MEKPSFKQFLRKFEESRTTIREDKLVTKEKRIKSFRQDAASDKGSRRLLTFEVEYVMPERRFAK